MRFPLSLSSTNFLLLALAASSVTAAKDSRTFAVLRFHNEGGHFSTEGRMDPIVFPGAISSHSHGIMGGSNFDLTIEGDQLLNSECTNALIAKDKSNYWVPRLFFQSPVNGTFKQVPLFYMQVYYLCVSYPNFALSPPLLSLATPSPNCLHTIRRIYINHRTSPFPFSNHS